ncbi:hypothetical protein HYX15_00470 [Candidatus Woesearchaeota archaeon]|nr:hypothetical protein [Candidatus Woesearchaeota archaeon]
METYKCFKCGKETKYELAIMEHIVFGLSVGGICIDHMNNIGTLRDGYELVKKREPNLREMNDVLPQINRTMTNEELNREENIFQYGQKVTDVKPFCTGFVDLELSTKVEKLWREHVFK